MRMENGFAAEGSRPNNLVRYAIGMFLHFFSPNCVVCNKVTVRGLSDSHDNAFQIGHIVPGGKKQYGWLPGNLATMCRFCNSFIDDTDCTPFIPDFKNAKGIPAASEWRPFSELKKLYPMPAKEGIEEKLEICEGIFGKR